MTGRGKMEFKARLVVVSEDGREDIEEAVHLEKEFSRIEQLGLTLAESKEILKGIQKGILERRTKAYVNREHCRECRGGPRRKKGHHDLTFRTLFGDVRLRSPRLHHCRCQDHDKELSARWSGCWKRKSPLSSSIWKRNGPRWSPTG